MRSFEQQPPLIPHKVDGYRIDSRLTVAWSAMTVRSTRRKMRPRSATATTRIREGKAMDKISMARYNCNLCHVPQVNAQPLVSNTFQSVKTGN